MVIAGERTGGLGDSLSVNLVKGNTGDDIGSHGSRMNSAYEDVALIGLDAMQRANSTLEDFVSILHSLEVCHLIMMN